MQKILGLVIFFILLTACSTPTPIATLNPQPSVNAISIGNGKAVALNIIDARTQSLSSAQIDPSQNVSQIFSDQISQGLTGYGFSPVTTPNAPQNKLTVKIVALNYRLASDYLSSNTETDGEIIAIAQNSSGTLTKTYWANKSNDSYLTGTHVDASSFLNSVVNKLLNDMLNDRALMQFLAS